MRSMRECGWVTEFRYNSTDHKWKRSSVEPEKVQELNRRHGWRKYRVVPGESGARLPSSNS